MNDMIDDIHVKKTRIGREKIFPRESIAVGLEGYTIKCEIGRGGMGVVYEAIEKSLNRVVALKVMGKEFSQDNELVKRFVNEAQAAARLNHPNIVQIYSIGEENGVYYFAMEYVKGNSVEGMLREGKHISVKDSLDIVRQTILALQAAYGAGIVHRDIKPGNILITEQGVVKVADFGLAAEIKDAPRIIGGKIIGTPLYMSPEQAQGQQGDHRSDMYSLGVTFYHMLCGNPPFISTETKELIDKQIRLPLPSLPHNVPQDMARLIYRLTNKDPDKRYSNYEVLIKTIDRIYNSYISKRRISPLLVTGLLIIVGIAIYGFVYRPIMKNMIVPPGIQKNKQIEAIYKNVVNYARENPSAYGEIIKEYFRIVKEYPDTEWSLRAEQKIDMIILAVAKEAADELGRLKAKRDNLIEQDKYQKAIDEYASILNKYKDTAAGSIASENISYIYEQARTRFIQMEDEAKKLINEHKFDKARELYKKVVSSFGIQEFIGEAKEKIGFIDNLEYKYKLSTEARNIFDPIVNKVDKLIEEHKFQEARRELKNISSVKDNPVLTGLIKVELDIVDGLQIEYESKVLKEKMESQYAIYTKLQDEVNRLITEFKFDEAINSINSNISRIEIIKWHIKLEDLLEKIKHLQFVKLRILNGINEVLSEKQKGLGSDIYADNDRLILVVNEGFVGIPWKELSPDRIYVLGQEYIDGNNIEHHVSLGVFCLVYDLFDESRKEFALVLNKDPNKQTVIEKYLIQLAEEGK